MFVIYLILIVAFLLVPMFYSKSEQIRRWGLAAFCFFLFFISAFRGDFTSDYSEYCRIYELFIGRDISIFFTPEMDVFGVEKGYAFLNYIFAQVFRDPQTIIIITSVIIVGVYYMFGKKANDKFLFLLLLINIGSYFQSFNITRQVLAASVCMLGYQYVEERKPIKYFAIVLLATTIHVSSIIMIPFYFLLRIKLGVRNILLQIVITVVIFTNFDSILQFMDATLFEKKYSSYEVFGTMDIQTVVVPLAISLFVVVSLIANTAGLKKEQEYIPDLRASISAKIQENAILYNGSIYWLLTYFLAIKYYYLYRFSSYFSLYAILAVVKSVENIKDGKMRFLIKSGIIILLSVYYLFFGQYFGNYKFCF